MKHSAEKRYTVVACLGTDHHRFDRLVEWLDDLATRRSDVDVVVQHGFSAAPRVATGHEFLNYEKLMQLIQDADAVVCHGGPGTIMDAHQAGHVPIMVPRDPQFGEHVDGHQLRFAQVVGQTERVQVTTEKADFDEAVEAQLRPDASARRRVPGQSMPEAAGLRVLAEELDSLTRHDVSRVAPVWRAVRQVLKR